MQAVILCGGLGTRLRPLTNKVQKSMVPIDDKPFLEYQINILKKFGVNEFVLCIGYLGEQIREYFGDGSEFGIKIIYSEEKEALGTAGAIKNAEKHLRNIFFALNGDCINDIDYNELLEFHKKNNAEATLVLTKVKDAGRYGTIVLDGKQVTDFKEKTKDNKEGIINAGTYVLAKNVLKFIEPDKKVSIEREVFPVLAKNRQLFGKIMDGYFIDIGTHETLEQLKKDIKNIKGLDT